MADRFWEKVARRPDGHWVWTAQRRRATGHGVFYPEQGRSTTAHRFAWTLVNGDPGALVVRHMCGNPSCVNPAHLAVGTAQDNADDRERDGNTARGERHARAILTEADVLDIRSSAERSVTLSARYGVAQSTISAVRARTNWRHV